MNSDEDIARQWGLTFDDVEFANARPKAMRVGLAAQLKHFQQTGRFLSDWADIPNDARTFLSEQVDAQRLDTDLYDFQGRSARRHCAEIVIHLGFMRMTERHRSALSDWLQVVTVFSSSFPIVPFFGRFILTTGPNSRDHLWRA